MSEENSNFCKNFIKILQKLSQNFFAKTFYFAKKIFMSKKSCKMRKAKTKIWSYCQKREGTNVKFFRKFFFQKIKYVFRGIFLLKNRFPVLFSRKNLENIDKNAFLSTFLGVWRKNNTWNRFFSKKYLKNIFPNFFERKKFSKISHCSPPFFWR